MFFNIGYTNTKVIYCHSTSITKVMLLYNTEWQYDHGMAVNYHSKKFYNTGPWLHNLVDFDFFWSLGWTDDVVKVKSWICRFNFEKQGEGDRNGARRFLTDNNLPECIFPDRPFQIFSMDQVGEGEEIPSKYKR